MLHIITTIGLISLSKFSFWDYVNEILKGMFCFTSLFADQVVQIILWSSIQKTLTLPFLRASSSSLIFNSGKTVFVGSSIPSIFLFDETHTMNPETVTSITTLIFSWVLKSHHYDLKCTSINHTCLYMLSNIMYYNLFVISNSLIMLQCTG